MLARCGRNARSPRKRQRRRTARAGSHRGVLKHGHLGESRRCGMTAEHSQAAGSIREAGCLRPAGELPRLQYRYPPLDPTTCHFIRDGLVPCRFISRLSPAPDPDFSLSRLPQSLARSRPDADLAWHRFAGLAGPVFPALYAVYGLLSGGPGRRLHPENIHRLGIAGALATWRVTQGIYCFDSDLAEAIADTPTQWRTAGGPAVSSPRVVRLHRDAGTVLARTEALRVRRSERRQHRQNRNRHHPATSCGESGNHAGASGPAAIDLAQLMSSTLFGTLPRGSWSRRLTRRDPPRDRPGLELCLYCA
jgi:hypothetical protein